jgi:hypothetical protein
LIRLRLGAFIRLIVPLIIALAAQTAWAGGHGSGSHSNGGTVHVSGYYRKGGTYVHPYTRAAPAYGSSSAGTAPNVYFKDRAKIDGLLISPAHSELAKHE